jgi:hypothetical protein
LIARLPFELKTRAARQLTERSGEWEKGNANGAKNVTNREAHALASVLLKYLTLPATEAV